MHLLACLLNLIALLGDFSYSVACLTSLVLYGSAAMVQLGVSPCRSDFRGSVLCVPGGDSQLLLEPYDLGCGGS